MLHGTADYTFPSPKRLLWCLAPSFLSSVGNTFAFCIVLRSIPSAAPGNRAVNVTRSSTSGAVAVRASGILIHALVTSCYILRVCALLCYPQLL